MTKIKIEPEIKNRLLNTYKSGLDCFFRLIYQIGEIDEDAHEYKLQKAFVEIENIYKELSERKEG